MALSCVRLQTCSSFESGERIVSGDAGATKPFLDYTHMYAFDTLDCGHVLVHSFEINVWSKFA